MKEKMYVKVRESEMGYISISDMFLEKDIEERYQSMVDFAKKMGTSDQVESLEGYKLQHLLIDVEFDGRKRKITENDVLSSMEKQGLVVKVGDNIFGGYFKKTAKLKRILNDQYNKRLELYHN